MDEFRPVKDINARLRLADGRFCLYLGDIWVFVGKILRFVRNGAAGAPLFFVFLSMSATVAAERHHLASFVQGGNGGGKR